MDFEALDLSVLVAGDGGVWISARSRMGAVYAVSGRGEGWSLEDLEDESSRLPDHVQHADRVPDEAIQLGTMLKDLLFGDPEILALFQRTRGAAADQARPVLVGVLGAPRQAAALPWELTLDPEGGRHEFLTLAPDVHVVRLPRVRMYPIRNDPIAAPLQVLLVLSSPIVSSSGDDSLTFDLYEEKRNMLDELAPLVDAGLLVVDVEDHPSLENLRRRISGRRRGYHVVHYLGHALATELMLEDRLGNERKVDATIFTELLQANPDLRLVVYAGCLTASLPEPDDGPRRDDLTSGVSIADLSVRVASPAVIGMQAVLPFRTERLFARFFYRAIAGGRTLADAVQHARAGIRRDEFVGGGRLDWAVPALFLGGVQPTALVDPSAPAATAQRRRRAELKLGLEEGERVAFARPVALREAIDILSGRRSNRVVLITGEPDVRIPFVGRLLDDLGDDVDLVLYAGVEEFPAGSDPVEQLCVWLAEKLTQLDGGTRARATAWSGEEWWKRLLEDLVDVRAVVALDGIDALPDEGAVALGRALEDLILRRTRARVLLSGSGSKEPLLGERARRRATPIPLRPLAWEEVWRWMRRNVPEVARYGAAHVQSLYEAGLQDDLELWTRLGEEAATRFTGDAKELARLAEEVLADRAPRSEGPSRPPLRAALTNPEIAGRVNEFADWMTALATEHKVGGRVLDPGRAGERSPIAELVPVETPFSEAGSADTFDIMQWVQQVIEEHADIVLLDFGAIGQLELSSRLSQLAKSLGALLIAAGGNTGDRGPVYPAWSQGILAVGALAADGMPASYSTWDPAAGKPDIFAPEDLSWAGGAGFVQEGQHGTSFAALGVTATALLVWFVDRSLSPADVRRTVLQSARRRRVTHNGRRVQIRTLDLGAALARVRTQLLLAALRNGPMGQRELLATTGLPSDIALALLEPLLDRGTLRRFTGPDTELIEINPGSGVVVG